MTDVLASSAASAAATSTAADRERYLHAGYTTLSCDSCATRVRVRKFSEEQTSVQWLTPAAGCPELAAHAAIGQPSALVPSCGQLRRSIENAFTQGLVEVGSVD
jgi:hypothetical protein